MKLKHFVFLIISLVLISCEFEDGDYRYNLGDDFIEDPTRVIMIDTLTVTTYTTAVDSVLSSRPTRFLSGRMVNKFGVVTTCESYFRFDPPEVGSLHHTAVYDSIVFVLYPDNYKVGDTTKINKLGIFELTEDITVDKETGFIYNTKQFAHEQEPIATFDVDMSKKNDSIVVKLPHEYGMVLFEKAFNLDEIYFEKELFNAKYKGFVIKPINSDASFVMGFSANADSLISPRIKVFYHDINPEDDLYFEFGLEKYDANQIYSDATSSNYFAHNYIVNDYTNTTLDGIKTGTEKNPGTDSDNVTFIQGGVNLRTRIEIPNIDNLYHLGIGSIIKATLYFEPVAGTFSKQEDLPASLEMYLIDEKNRSYGQLSLIGSQDPAIATLNYNTIFKNQTFYTFDITQFFRDEYVSRTTPEFSLLMALPQSVVTNHVSQLIIGTQENKDHQLRLKIYITNY